MKFGRTVQLADAKAPPVFQGSFLNHKGLKKFLKFRHMQLKQLPAGSIHYQQALQSSIKEFLTMVASQLKEVDRRFETEARNVIKEFDAKKPKRKSSILHRRAEETKIDPRVAGNLADRADWCQEYARINAQALRKICKKLDKILSVKSGQQFLQACWRGDIAVKSFLSAPLLSELAAVEVMARGYSDPGHITEHLSEDSSISHSSLADPESMKCPICLDVMYLPLALECGHRFCSRCAIAAALGHDGQRGDVNTLLQSGPVGRSEAPCPQCRATEHGNTEGVFYNAQRLPHMDELIKTRYPVEWNRRKEEDEEEQKGLKAAQQHRVPQGLFTFFRNNGMHAQSPQSSQQTSNQQHSGLSNSAS